MTMSVTRPCFTKRHQTCKTKTKTDFFSLRPVLSIIRPTVSDHITGSHEIVTKKRIGRVPPSPNVNCNPNPNFNVM